jgi:hypothetical protein
MSDWREHTTAFDEADIASLDRLIAITRLNLKAYVKKRRATIDRARKRAKRALDKGGVSA